MSLVNRFLLQRMDVTCVDLRANWNSTKMSEKQHNVSARKAWPNGVANTSKFFDLVVFLT